MFGGTIRSDVFSIIKDERGILYDPAAIYCELL